CRDGSAVWVETECRLEDATSGRRGQLVLFSLDISARKQTEGALQEKLALTHAARRDRAAELERRTAQLSRLASELTAAEQHAREQLAKTLHDHLQQLLFGAKLELDRLERPRAPARAAQADPLRGVRSNLDAAIDAARTLAVELCPPVLHARGL